jgi:hypothetical protein
LTINDVLEQQRQRVVQANADLIESCCLSKRDCIHARINQAIMGDPTQLNEAFSKTPRIVRRTLDKTPFSQKLKEGLIFREINTPDSHGNNALFFAARVGAPSEVLLSILAYTTDLNMCNEDGQTFLFFLDAASFQLRTCLCSQSQLLSLDCLEHFSAFDCLINILEQHHFNFDRADHDGRTFLSFLCASPSFDFVWVGRQVERSSAWAHRIATFWQLRDSSGKCFNDFRSSASIADPDVLKLAARHDHEFFLDSYDEYGHTALTKALQYAHDQKGNEAAVLTTVRPLVSNGCNVNARSRDGNTALVIAAKRNCPETVAYLLSVDAQPNYRDKNGFTALDYATENFVRSRRHTAPATATSRSIASSLRLLDVVRPGRRKQSLTDDEAIRLPSPLEEGSQRSLTAIEHLQYFVNLERNASPYLYGQQ